MHLYILTGASKGMGRAIAEQILDKSNNILLSISRSPINADNLKLASGAKFEHWCHDLAQAQSLAQRLEKWLISLNMNQTGDFASAHLINNAALIPPVAPLSQTDPNALIEALRVGLEAPMLLSRAFLRGTANWSCPKKLLNISSGLGRRPMASQATYCAVKAGLDNFSHSLALEEALKPNGAKVCSLAPGVIDTGMQLQLRSSAPEDFPDVGRFIDLHVKGLLTSPKEAATQVLSYLSAPSFGRSALGDVRE